MMKKPDEFQEKTELTTETKAKITATLERLKEDGLDLYGCDYVDVKDLAYIYHAAHYLLRYVDGLQATIAGQEIAQVDFCRQIKQLEAERDEAVTCIGKLTVILKTYPYAATNCCAYEAYKEIEKYIETVRGVQKEG